MTGIKVSFLEGRALDWAVAQIDRFCEGLEWRPAAEGRAWAGFGKVDGAQAACAYLSHGSCLSERMRMRRDGIEPYSPSTNWSQGGLLIEAHRASIEWYGDLEEWCADTMETSAVNQFGPSPLIAACRAIVAAEIGDVVEVPEQLVSQGSGKV
tara:strand:- start:3297 stop:3755 length:459 start_codon:yes stop_codon:yes gene_type:complete